MAWQKHSSKIVFENPWMQVRVDRVINPGGGQNDYGYVHFRNRAVAIVALDEDANTWLVGQHRYTLDEYSWELPMGGAPLGESPLEAARRELAEVPSLLVDRSAVTCRARHDELEDVVRSGCRDVGEFLLLRSWVGHCATGSRSVARHVRVRETRPGECEENHSDDRRLDPPPASHSRA